MATLLINKLEKEITLNEDETSSKFLNCTDDDECTLSNERGISTRSKNCQRTGPADQVESGLPKFEPFMCDVCNESFSMKSHLTHHSNLHKFECGVCKKTFTQKCSLKTHSLIHNGTKPYVCEVCNRGFGDRSTLRKHSLIHSGARPHICHVCNRTFVQKVTLRKHILTHTGEKSHVCEMCGRAFAQKSTLRTHYRTHVTNPHRFIKRIGLVLNPHDNPKDGSENNSLSVDTIEKEINDVAGGNQQKDAVSSSSDKNEGRRQSKRIKDLISSQKSLNLNNIKSEVPDNDLIQRMEISIEPDDQSIIDDLLLEHISVKVESVETLSTVESNEEETHAATNVPLSLYTCKVCQQSFVENYLLIEHVYSHVKQQSQEALTVNENTLDQQRTVEELPTDVPNFICDKCGYGFSDESLLETHYLCHFSDKKCVTSFMCEFCGKVFSRQLAFERHYQTHTAKKHNSDEKGITKRRKKSELQESPSNPVLENKRKQRVPRKVLKAPGATDEAEKSSTATSKGPVPEKTSSVQKNQFLPIPNQKCSCDKWNSDTDNQVARNSDELFFKYLVPCIELVESTMNLHDSFY